MNITVHHRLGAYEVVARPLATVADALPENAVVLTDAHLAAAYPAWVGIRPSVVVPAGEGSKSAETYLHCLGRIAELGADRKTTLVAFGGGVVGDLGGFVAGTYMRGIAFHQVPTSLLAMVDSSVGGKVGIDLPAGKNLVGAFVAPVRVDVPLEALRTLPRRQFVNGMAEVVKYGLIGNLELLDRLRNAPPISTESGELAGIVETCIRDKARVVMEDEFETTGLRATLNFGHTIGHAIEQVTGYGPILHGEAISIGMVLEARLTHRLGLCEEGTIRSVSEALTHQGLPIALPAGLDPDALLAAMRRDKKADRSGLAFSLVTRPGECKLTRGVPEGEVRAVLTAS